MECVGVEDFIVTGIKNFLELHAFFAIYFLFPSGTKLTTTTCDVPDAVLVLFVIPPVEEAGACTLPTTELCECSGLL